MAVLAINASRGDFKVTCAASSNAKVSRLVRDLQQIGDRYDFQPVRPLQSFLLLSLLLNQRPTQQTTHPS